MPSADQMPSSDMFLGRPASLPSLVGQRFVAAKQTGALVFSHTEVTTIATSKIPFQLRYCPALAKKPTQPPPDAQQARNKATFDPFANPSSDLLIAEIPKSKPTHFLVLNKFPVIPNHFILATKPYKDQTDLLEKDDLEATYCCLRAWETSNDQGPSKRLFAFFNSGEHSGASQPHRHLQFLPVEDMTQQDDQLNWAPLIDGHHPDGSDVQSDDHPRRLNLPFACYAIELPRDPSAETLHRIYMSLYRTAVAAANGQAADSSSRGPDNPTHLPTEGPSAISYNLAMTTSRMIICPRRSEYAWIQIDESSKVGLHEEGLVKLNGTILAGTLMVKAESEWKALQEQPAMLEGVLQTIGFPWSVVSSKI